MQIPFGKGKENRGINKEARLAFWGGLALCIVCSIPAFARGSYEGNDLIFHMYRMQGIAEGLKEGQFPVRMNPVFYNGYGYASGIMYGNFFLYPFALLYLLGMGISSAYNCLLVGINMMTVAISYHSFRKLFKDDMVGFAVTTIYVLAPYRLVDAYMRSSVGELLALAFLPLVLYGFVRIMTEDTEQASYRYCFLPLCFGMSGIIMSHVLSVEMTAGVLALACLFCIKRVFHKKRCFALFKAALCTGLLNAWFLFPFLDYFLTQDMNVRHGSGKLIQTTGLFFTQLFQLFPVYGRYSKNAGDGITGELPLSPGLALILGAALFLGLYLAADVKSRQQNKTGLLCLVLGLITLFMATVYCPWDGITTRFPFLSGLLLSIQFTWRFLGQTCTLLAVVAGYGFMLLKKQVGQEAYTALLGFIIILAMVSGVFAIQQTMDNERVLEGHTVYDLPYDTVIAVEGAEYNMYGASMDAICNITEPRLAAASGALDEEQFAVTGFYKKGLVTSFHVKNTSQTVGQVILPLLGYKGYEVRDSAEALKNSDLFISYEKMLALQIPAGYEGDVTVSFAGCGYWRIGDLISLVSLLTFVGLAFGGRMLGEKAKAEKK